MNVEGKKLEYVELALCLHVHSDSRLFVQCQSFCQSLYSKVKKVNHSAVAPLALLMRQLALVLQRIFK
jgi:hypothetical protein